MVSGLCLSGVLPTPRPVARLSSSGAGRRRSCCDVATTIAVFKTLLVNDYKGIILLNILGILIIQKWSTNIGSFNSHFCGQSLRPEKPQIGMSMFCMNHLVCHVFP